MICRHHNNHFQELRRQIDLHRGELNENSYDNIALDMIDRIKMCETTYLKSLFTELDVFLKSLENKSIEKDLHDMENQFGNSNLFSSSIREIYLAKNQLLQETQEKLNLFTQVKYHLVTTNCFTQSSSFGSLNLSQFSSSPFQSSSILNESKPFELIQLCEFISNQK